MEPVRFLRRGAVALLSLGLAATTPAAWAGHQEAAEPATASGSKVGLNQVDFFLGEWSVEARSPDGNRVVGRARTEVRHILDGRALQADYYGLDPAGRTVFRGTTIRTWVPATGRFTVHWAMAELGGYTHLEEEYRGGELHAEGHGVDDQGEFLERYRYFDLSPEHYSFEMSRSYDKGATWQPWVFLRATRPEAAP